MTRVAILLLCLFVPAAAADETPTWQQYPTKNGPRKHVMVQFTDMSLHPSIAVVLEGGTISWVNYASMYDGTIVFSKAVAQAFPCDLQPDWSDIGTGYQSIPITMEGAMGDLQIPCPMKPGEYEYEIWLFEPGMGGPGAMDDPQSRMQGKIIVQ